MHLSEFSAIMRVMTVFLIMFTGIRKKLSVPVVFIGGSCFLALLFPMLPIKIVLSAFYAATSIKTITLASTVSLIIIFGVLLEKSGSTVRMGELFKNSEKKGRIGLAAFPALIGLLPVPGGAVFSAPLVKSIAENHGLGPSRMSLINYWYRHVWEYLWPLYPGVLLASSITGIGLDTLAKYMFPFTLLAILLGLRFLPSSQLINKSKFTYSRDKSSFLTGLREIIPILIIVLPVLLLSPYLSKLYPSFTAIRELILITALICGIIYVIITGSLKTAVIKESLSDKRLPEMFLMILSIMIFKKILEDTGAAQEIGDEIRRTGVPVYLAAFLLPFITGMVTGISVAFIGISLPVVVSIAGISGNAELIKPLTFLAISSGFMGVMLSPLHLCLILSNSYFEADQAIFYKKLAPPCLTIILFSFIYYQIIRII